jgi:nucleotide-binding universal stress UspA family protein
MSTRTILVAHDFTAADVALADIAGMVAGRVDATSGGDRWRIVLLHCLELVAPPPGLEFEPAGTSLARSPQAQQAEAARALERFAERLRARADAQFAGTSPITIEVVVRVAPAVEGILDEARTRDVERIIIGTHARGGLHHLLLGSVAERVARMAHVPVVVMHGTRADAQGGSNVESTAKRA